MNKTEEALWWGYVAVIGPLALIFWVIIFVAVFGAIIFGSLWLLRTLVQFLIS